MPIQYSALQINVEVKFIDGSAVQGANVYFKNFVGGSRSDITKVTDTSGFASAAVRCPMSENRQTGVITVYSGVRVEHEHYGKEKDVSGPENSTVTVTFDDVPLPAPPTPPPPPTTYSIRIDVSTIDGGAGSQGGSTHPAPGVYICDEGEKIQLIASAYTDFRFEHWLIDNSVYSTKPEIEITVDRTMIITAVFSEIAQPPPEPPAPPAEGTFSVTVKAFVYLLPSKAKVVLVDSGFHALGDVNWDGIIDGYDADMMDEAVGSSVGDTNWNPECDLNGDGRVDYQDVAILKANLGKSAPGYDTPFTAKVPAGKLVALGIKGKQKLRTTETIERDAKILFFFTPLGILGKAVVR